MSLGIYKKPNYESDFLSLGIYKKPNYESDMMRNNIHGNTVLECGVSVLIIWEVKLNLIIKQHRLLCSQNINHITAPVKLVLYIKNKYIRQKI